MVLETGGVMVGDDVHITCEIELINNGLRVEEVAETQFEMAK